MTSYEPSSADLTYLEEAVSQRLQKVNSIDDEIERMVDADTVANEIENALTPLLMKTKKNFIRTQDGELPWSHKSGLFYPMSNPVRNLSNVNLPKITLKE